MSPIVAASVWVSLGICILGCAHHTHGVRSGTGSINAPKGMSDLGHAQAIPLADLPSSLKNGSFRWYGLGNAMPLEYQITSVQGVSKQLGRSPKPQAIGTGGQLTELIHVEPRRAIFQQTRSGALSELMGTDVLSLSADGIRIQKSSLTDVDQNNLEFPPDPKPGVSWRSHDVLDRPGEKFDLKSTLKVVRYQKIATKRGRLDALVVKSNGIGTENGLPLRMETQMYFVQDLGLAKYVIDEYVNGRHSEITQEISR